MAVFANLRWNWKPAYCTSVSPVTVSWLSSAPGWGSATATANGSSSCSPNVARLFLPPSTTGQKRRRRPEEPCGWELIRRCTWEASRQSCCTQHWTAEATDTVRLNTKIATWTPFNVISLKEVKDFRLTSFSQISILFNLPKWTLCSEEGSRTCFATPLFCFFHLLSLPSAFSSPSLNAPFFLSLSLSPLSLSLALPQASAAASRVFPYKVIKQALPLVRVWISF